MTTDRELLERAAAAIGYDVWFDENGEPIGWDPRYSDSDALQLAGALHIDVRHFDDSVTATRHSGDTSHIRREPCGADAYKRLWATRRAILRSAADTL